MRKNKPRPEFEALIPRIQSGELTRSEAAAIASQQTGLKPGTFLSWVISSGASEILTDTRGTVGANSIHFKPDKVEDYENALAKALSGKVSPRQAAIQHGVSYSHLLKKLRKAQEVVALKDPQDEAEVLVRELLQNPQKVLALAKAMKALNL